MVDSCFEMFKKVRCCTKPEAKSHKKSEESIFRLENNNDKYKHVTTVTSFDSNKCNNNTDDDDDNNYDVDNSLDVEHVHLRRHPRIAYCRSFSTSDALSTDDELMDILCPLPRVNTLERPIIEASAQNINGR